jgi:hypothetical protein
MATQPNSFVSLFFPVNSLLSEFDRISYWCSSLFTSSASLLYFSALLLLITTVGIIQLILPLKKTFEV